MSIVLQVKAKTSVCRIEQTRHTRKKMELDLAHLPAVSVSEKSLVATQNASRTCCVHLGRLAKLLFEHTC
jgi:hypothetical protein